MERVADGPLASARKEKGIQFANEPAECRTSEVRLRPGATILACDCSALVRIAGAFITAWIEEKG